jgi:hypothetical protein
VDSDLPP